MHMIHVPRVLKGLSSVEAFGARCFYGYRDLVSNVENRNLSRITKSLKKHLEDTDEDGNGFIYGPLIRSLMMGEKVIDPACFQFVDRRSYVGSYTNVGKNIAVNRLREVDVGDQIVRPELYTYVAKVHDPKTRINRKMIDTPLPQRRHLSSRSMEFVFGRDGYFCTPLAIGCWSRKVILFPYDQAADMPNQVLAHQIWMDLERGYRLLGDNPLPDLMKMLWSKK